MCVSFLPCLHNFCASCASQCLKSKKDECPVCRTKATEVRRNHDLNNLVEQFLKNNPERKRDAEELAELDAQNTLTSQSLRIAGKKRRRSYSDDEDDHSGSESDSYESEDYDPPVAPVSCAPPPPPCPLPSLPSHAPAQAHGQATLPMPVPIAQTCFNCTTAAPDGFCCSSVAGTPQHVNCQCCQGLMPRRATAPVRPCPAAAHTRHAHLPTRRNALLDSRSPEPPIFRASSRLRGLGCACARTSPRQTLALRQ